MGTIGDESSIEVEFITDEVVTHIIKDTIVPIQSKKKRNDVTAKYKSEVPCSAKKSLSNRPSESFSPESTNSDNVELPSTNKPKALFEEGDVPGACMFSFNSSKQKKASSQITIAKTPNSIKKETSNIRKRLLNVKPKALFDDDNEDNYDNDKKISTRSISKLNKTTSKIVSITQNNDLNKKMKVNQNSSISIDSNTTMKANNVQVTKINKKSNIEIVDQTSDNYVSSDNLLTKTPKVVRKKIAKEIAQQKLEQLSELNDTDYSNSEKSDESDSDSSIHFKIKSNQPEVANNLRRSIRKKEVSFLYKAEEYFLSKTVKSMKKSKTSDNTLKLLKNPTLEKSQIDKIANNVNYMHKEKYKQLYQGITSNFPYWYNLLKEGFNLLLYGLGSKKQLIDDFQNSMLKDELVIVINGFCPGLTLKEILESITIDLLELENCPGSAELAIQQIEQAQKSKNADQIFLLVHNIDGNVLQNYKVQHVLSRICSLENIHLIASIDRVNAALMWDNTKLGDYNFIWMDCTSYNSYSVETSFMESLMVKNTGATHTLSALSNVYKSLTSNSKRILLLLIKDRIENKNDKKYVGVPFSILYGWCRQQFLVSTDLALRSQLTEFVDHELVKWKRDSDLLQILLEVDILIQFYKQNQDDEV
ncbi:origin recognition complex subunit 2 [Daktulosphaira vitifoliae]|uniref:origin recognition complex subunit 2 n=1 Tax=Daktulosphaira vitifoliae TaxID=58002 RepID=UPI0021AA20A1|nr:origin recognition complex subunit 2 [Daktulosphaira vitifoliae]